MDEIQQELLLITQKYQTSRERLKLAPSSSSKNAKIFNMQKQFLQTLKSN